MAEISLLDRLRSAPDRSPGERGGAGGPHALRNRLLMAALGALACFIAAVLAAPEIKLPVNVFKEHEIAADDVRATVNFFATDTLATEARRREAFNEVKPVYEFAPNALDSAVAAIRSAFEETGPEQPDYDAATVSRLVLKNWAVTPTPTLAQSLASLEERRDFEEVVSTFLSPLYQRGVVVNRDMLIRESERGITVRNTVTGVERPIVEPRNTVDFDAARRELASAARREVSSYQELARVVAHDLLRPNLVFNGELTLRQRQKAAEEVAPVLYLVRKGEVLVREGDRVRAEQEEKLVAHAREIERSGTTWTQHLLLFAGLFLTTAICIEYGRANIRKARLASKDLAFVAFTFLLMLFLQRIGAVFADRIPSGALALVFAVPMAAGLVTVRMVLNSETALVTAIPYLAAASLGAGLETGFFFPLVIGALFGAHVAGRVTRRVEFLRIGVYTGVAQAAAMLLIISFKGTPLGTDAWWQVGGAFAGGLLTGLAALGFVPLAETVFGYATDMRLVELASLDHPLLRELMLVAPGTYHHSMVTGTLVKGAAEAIGARSVLATTACYFHDIGKIHKAAYFIENQEVGRNPHDKLNPSMSALILISHVKEGAEASEKYRLGKDITDIIRQHHGTSLIRYFYQKASESARPGVDEVHEDDYRYPGPKPQSREAALVMLADAVEAATRSLSDPKPALIQGTVQNLINRIFADGQLDECDLSLKDLHSIARSFVHTLGGIYHQRIDYPLAAHKERKDDGSADQKRQSDGRAGRATVRAENEENLKRLGQR